MTTTLSYPRPTPDARSIPVSAFQSTLPAPDALTGEPRFQLLQAGSRVLRYELEEQVGKGGFGTVYRARDLTTGEPVALKILHDELAVSPDMVDRFRREAMSLNRIRHDNIVQVRDVGTLADGRPFFTMEWIAGQSLACALDRTGPLAPVDVMPVLDQLTGALQAAHDAGLVHRDLKASNVMVNDDGRLTVKLIDFGIAKLLDGLSGDSSLTASGGFLGSPCSVSPEQILGGAVDRRTDVYGLGTMLFHLFTGAFPYAAPNALAVQEKHLNAPVPRVSDRVPVGPAIDEVVARCMAKRRRDRYDSVLAVRDALRCAIEAPAVACSAVTTLPAETRVDRGIAFHVELAIEESGMEEIDGELRRAGRALLGQVRRELEAAGLDVEISSATGLLGIRLVRGGDLEVRRRLLATALNLAYAPAGDGSSDPRIQVRITAHAGDVMVAPHDGSSHYLAGDLVEVEGWAGGAQAGLTATDAALDGLDEAFVLVPAGPGRRAVLASC